MAGETLIPSFLADILITQKRLWICTHLYSKYQLNPETHKSSNDQATWPKWGTTTSMPVFTLNKLQKSIKIRFARMHSLLRIGILRGSSHTSCWQCLNSGWGLWAPRGEVWKNVVRFKTWINNNIKQKTNKNYEGEWASHQTSFLDPS